MISTNELIKTLRMLRAFGMSWGEITKRLYPDKPDKELKRLRPILYRMMNNGYYPKSNKLRKRLGLVFLKEVEACPECNEVHLDRCPKVELKELPHFHKMVETPACPDCGRDHPIGICPEKHKVIVTVYENEPPAPVEIRKRRNGRKRRPRPSYKRLWQQSLLLMAWMMREEKDGGL